MKIHLDPNLKNIAVRLSGGPDSSIIYHAVCDFYRDDPDARIYPYTVSTPLRPHSGPKSAKVVEIVESLTGVAPTKHYIGWNPDHNASNDRDRNALEYTKGQEDLEAEVFANHPIDIRYAGVSVNCPTNELVKAIYQYDLNRAECEYSLTTRDPSRDVPTQEVLGEMDGRIMCLPFAKHDKRAVYETFVEYGVLDNLFPHTWSCEHGSQANIEDPVHCGKCFFCMERIYAFGRLS